VAGSGSPIEESNPNSDDHASHEHEHGRSPSGLLKIRNLNQLACMMESNLASFHQMLASQMAAAVHPARVIRPISGSPTAETDAIVVLGVRSLLFIQGLTLPKSDNPTLHGGIGAIEQAFNLGAGPNFRHC